MTKRPRVLASIALLGTFLHYATPVVAVTYYVRGSGNDGLDGLSPATAFGTIRRAAELLLEPGDEVIVGPGLYFEANIAPQRDGSPDLPIVLRGDPTGVLTADFAGPVTVAPSNVVTPDRQETTGFLLFGKHDIVIEGFMIEGAADAGIQVRPQFSTGIDSTRITLRQNDIREGRHGIQVLAAGDVTIEGNVLRDQTDVAISLASAAKIPLRPLVRDNLIERNTYGIVLERTVGGEIVENQFMSNDIAVKLADPSTVSIRGNDLGFGRIDGSGRDLQLVDNLSIGQVRLDTAGTVLFQSNQIAGGMTLVCDPQGTLQLLDNELSSVTEIRGTALLDVQRNEARIIDAVTEGAIIARENNFSRIATFLGKAELELVGNGAASLRARGTRATATDNSSLGRLEITGDVGEVRRNEADVLVLFQRDTPVSEGGTEEGTWVVADSVVGRSLVAGGSRAPLSAAIVRGNRVASGSLQIHARGPLQVSQNEAAGIACLLRQGAHDVSLTNNLARGSRTSGLIVTGADNAVIEANTSSESMGSGLSVRRTKTLTATGNTLRSNGTGGIAVRTIPALGGDCNGDGTVSVDEVVVCTAIALAQLPLQECDAVDFNGDELVMVDEVVRAVAGALGSIAPLPPEIREGEVLLQDNLVEDNAEFGIKVLAPGSIAAIGNQVLGNGGVGIAAEAEELRQEVDIIGNAIGSSTAEGILVRGGEGARVRNNLVFNNGQGGILLRNAPGAEIVNNLIYVNDNDGIAVGVGTKLPSPNAMILNNTLYANDGWGVTIGSAGAPSAGVMILNNIFDWNASGGIAADLGSLGGLAIGFNLNNDGYSHEVTPAVTDFPADPRFIDPAGADGVLGGAGFADDDFHVAPTSAAVDAGSTTAAELGITGSAVAGLENDEGIVDLGFHYGADTPSEDPQTPGSK